MRCPRIKSRIELLAYKIYLRNNMIRVRAVDPGRRCSRRRSPGLSATRKLR
ncbi:hypothetical protein GLE_2651 [Lysobacter enzymogenes]|uniref:Uncharacterized protein n=1 Tax=Lysobacter enzymogenes TaxID=69 RepID=A0A0S2DID2_LYSEN|nr:hypothetical protein GLE_2651 [Lysobacter enzymogenes]